MADRKRQNGDGQGTNRLKKRRTTALPATRTIATRSATRTSAFNAVFRTTELLEHILSFLLLKSLCVAQSVCTKWRDVIKQVKQLQQHLFLERATPMAAWRFWPVGAVRHVARLSPMPPLSAGAKLEDGITFLATLHPLMELSDMGREHDAVEHANGEIGEFRDAARWSRQPGSWRDMFVTQPPALTVFCEYHLREEQDGKVGKVCYHHDFVRADGVRMGDLIDHGRKLEAEEGRAVRWERSFIQAYCRVSYTDEEIEKAEAGGAHRLQGGA